MRRHTPDPARTPRSQATRRAFLAILLAIMAVAMVVVQQPVAEAQSTEQGSVGVTPATIAFTDPPLLPDGTSQGVLTFQQRYDQPVEVHVQTVPVDPSVGDAHEWIRLERSGHLTLTPATHRFPFHIQVPEATPNGVYKAGVAFDVKPPQPTPQENSSATTETSVTATILIHIESDNETKRLIVDGQPQIPQTEEGAPLRIVHTLTNAGNVNIVPRLQIEVHDQLQKEILKEFTVPGRVLAPGQTQDQAFVVQDPGLERGQYWVVVKTLLGDEVVQRATPQTVDVLAPGELARAADLRIIMIEDDRTSVATGKLVKLTAVVENVGQGVVVAEFDGEVRRDGELVEPLTSKPVEIGTGEQGNLTMLYRVGEPGKYEFVGRVFYGSKVTEEKSLLLTVEDDTANLPAPGPLPVLAVLVALLAGVAHAGRTRVEGGTSRTR